MTKRIYIVRQNDMILKAFTNKIQAEQSKNQMQVKWRQNNPDKIGHLGDGFNIFETDLFEKE